ncbi:MAG: IPT/TIG domain-containing protein [Sphingobacteriaceae bacterium]
MRFIKNTFIYCSLSFLHAVFLIVIALQGCGKEKAAKPELPPASVKTSELTFISPISVKLVGKLTNEGTLSVLDHGFIYWFGAEGTISAGTKVALGATSSSDFFTTTINDLKFPIIDGYQADLVVKAYVTDKSGTHYGEIFSSKYRGGLVSTVNPSGGKTGDVVTINGHFTGLNASQIMISFGDIPASIKTVTADMLTVEVPKGIPVGHGQTVTVKAQVGVITTGVNAAFYIWANIKDIHPKSGPIGTKVSFVGDNLPLNKDDMSVDFGEGYSTRYYDQEFFVRVPSSVTSIKNKLYYYQKGNEKIALPFEFTVTPPVIKSVTPNPSFANQEVIIHMENMLYYPEGNAPMIRISDFSTHVQPNEQGEIIFRLEGQLVPGKSYPVTVAHGPHTVTAPVPLIIAKPEVTDFSPKKGFPGTAIHIFGKFAKGGTNFVMLDGRLTLFANAISDTELVTYIPMGILNKTYTLSIKDETGDIKVPGLFEGQSTQFDSVLPASGQPGSAITITGKGFYALNSNFTTNFGGWVAYSTNITFDKIVFVVPADTTPGTYPIKVTHGSVEYDTGLKFTVTA